jgi:hypothetical protein
VPEEYQRPEWNVGLVTWRPWWSGSYLVACRDDLNTNPALPPDANYGPGCIYTPPKTTGGKVDSADRDAACAAFDEKYPIPFPGFRVGQIWGVDMVGTFLVSDPLTRSAISDAYEPRTKYTQFAISYSAGSGRRYHKLFGVRDYDGFNTCPVFLLHDPLCPSAVPWSGYLPEGPGFYYSEIIR